MSVSKNSQIIRTAVLYYLHSKTQQEIAKEMGISRPTVAKLLEEARAQKIVEIKLNLKEEINVQLSAELRDLLHLSEVVVVANSGATEDLSIIQTAQVTAEYLRNKLRENTVLGVSWGRILKETANALPSTPIPSMKVVQIAGGLGSPDSAYDGSEVSYIFASRLQASYRPIFGPAILPDAELAEKLREVPTIRDALDSAMKADIYLTGIGTLDSSYNSSLQRAGYIDNTEKKQLIEQGGKAHLIARIIKSDGSELDSFNNRTVAIPLEQLKKGHTICVTTSAKKAEAVLAVIRGGYVKTLIMDEECALEILRLMNKGIYY